MPFVGAFVHDHVDHAAQCAAILGLNARGLHLYFRDEVEWNVGVGVTADDVGRLLAFNQVGVLRVGAAADREAEGAAVAAVAGRGAAAAVAQHVAAFQRLIARRRGKLNDRLERSPVRNILEHVFRDIGQRAVGGGIDHRPLGLDLNHGADRADFQRKVDGGEVADLKRQP